MNLTSHLTLSCSESTQNTRSFCTPATFENTNITMNMSLNQLSWLRQIHIDIIEKNHQSFQPTCAATTRTAAKQCANISITNQVQRGSSQAKQSKHPWKQFWMLPLLVSTLPGYLLCKLLPAQTYLPPFCLQRSSLPQHESMVVICFQKRGGIIH